MMAKTQVFSSFGWFNRCVYCGRRILTFGAGRKIVNAHPRCWLNDDEDGTL